MVNLLVPILITTSSSIYGWNALYASGNVPEMQERAFHNLNKKAQEKCGTGEVIRLSEPEYTYSFRMPNYVDHAFLYIECGRAL